MECPHCGSRIYSRSPNANPAPRDGIVFRRHVCNARLCGRTFLSAQLVVINEFEPVERLDAVLKALMDESDARARVEIEGAESLEGLDE